MLTPQEVEAQIFPKSSFGGYSTTQVDAFLTRIVEDYRTAYQENTTLKSKLKLLVDKIEEYRSTEDAMRMTLHSAQKMAAAIVEEGQTQKQNTLEQAAQEAQALKDALRKEMEQEAAELQKQIDALRAELANEQARLQAARTSTAAYVEKLKELYTRELEYIGGLSSLVAGQPESPPQAPVSPPPPQEPQPEDADATKVFPAVHVDKPPASDLGETRAFDKVQFSKEHGEA